MKNLLVGNRKYFSVFVLLIAVVVVIGIISPLFLKVEGNNWKETQPQRIDQIQSEAKLVFQGFFDELNQKEVEIREYFNIEVFEEEQYHHSLKFLSDELSGFVFTLYDSNDKHIIWTNSVSPDEKQFIVNQVNEGIQFFNTGLVILLGKTGSITINRKKYFYFIGKPVKKLYSLNNSYYQTIDLDNYLTESIGSKFEIEYSPNKVEKKNSRYYSFDITNQINQKIGFARFQIPSEEQIRDDLNQTISIVQSLTALFAFLFLLIGIIKIVSKEKLLFLRFCVISISLAGFRISLFLLEIPTRFFTTGLFEPKYFSSTFGYGIVKSPFELFISSLFVLVIGIYAFKLVTDSFLVQKIIKPKPVMGFILFPVVILIFLLLLRSIGAITRSVIFDSSILYFSDFSLISDPPAFLMQINVLIVGLALLALQVALVLVFIKYFKLFQKNKNINLLIILSGIFVGAILFHYLQPNPQVPIYVKIMTIGSIFTIIYFVKNQKIGLSLTITILSFVASVITAILLNFYNTQQQKESLKELAYDITRPKSNWYEYLTHETLMLTDNINICKNSFNKSQDFYPAAFEIWANSSLQKESIRSAVVIYNAEKEIVGDFYYNFDTKKLPNLSEFDASKVESFIRKTSSPNDFELISGLKTIAKGDSIVGFLNVSVLVSENKIDIYSSPPFLPQNATFLHSNIDFNKLNIFDFHNEVLTQQYGDLNLTGESVKNILSHELSPVNDLWLNFTSSGEGFLAYITKLDLKDGERRIAIVLKQKDLSIDLFHFFKVFFAHSIFLLFFVLIYIISAISKKENLVWSFRRKIFFAFLIISIFPMVLMAIYFRGLTSDKNESAINYKLRKRGINVEQYLNHYMLSSGLNQETVFEKAANDLGINYSIFKDNQLLYSSYNHYYFVELLPSRINLEAYYELELLGQRSFITDEQIESYSFNSFYYKSEILGEEYIIKVSDVFNPILLPVTGTELDIFLFGSYSLAVIIIIITSTILANQISSPIRELTFATKSVAGGDYGFEVHHENKGEVRGLVEEFNFMIREVQKSQRALAELERETAWKEMAKQVAHEIKNPLTPMKLSVQQLVIAYKDKAEKFEEIFNKVTKTLISQIDTLTGIASEFSSFARMPSIRVEEVELNDVIQEAINLFSEESININYKILPKKLLVKADTTQLKRTIINLFRNSIQAKASSVNISVKEQNRSIQILITDNGSGIDERIINKVFDINFTTKDGGMGLGLNIAKRFLENVGGEIGIQSTNRGGTTIFIKLEKITKNESADSFSEKGN